MLKNPYFEAATVQAEGAWAAKRRLAAAIRRINDLQVTSDAPEEELERVAAVAERLAETLARHPHRRGVRGYAESSVAGDVGAFFDQSPLVGLCNPVSPPMRVVAEGDEVAGTVVFGSPYEGPPGHVHGGFIAAAFDEVLGFAQCLTGSPGMTARLMVNFKSPTPLHEELRLRARVVGVQGRKIYTSAEMRAGATTTAEAEGLFVSIDGSRLAALAESGVSP